MTHSFPTLLSSVFSNIVDRSWDGRVLVERVEGFCSEAEWRRAYDEINAFEAEQVDDNTTIVKLFIHVTQDEQDRRFAERLEDPWKRWKTGLEDYRNRARRAEYLDAIQEMLARTNSHWAPWTVIDGNNQKAARIAARSEEHTSELQSLMRISYAVFCLK